MECLSLKDAESMVGQLRAGDWLIVDIDDTVIAPQAMMLHPHSPFSNFFDVLKKENKENLPEVLSTWRLSRKINLVEPEWAETIHSLKERGITVIALTAMHTGPYGRIESMEKWRAAELASLGITFSEFAPDAIEVMIDSESPATLHKGILFTGPHPKDVVLDHFIESCEKPRKIIFFDDRLHQIELLGAYCQENSIEYLGFHYLGASQRPYIPEKDYGEVQTKALLEKGRWLEDFDVEGLDVENLGR